MQELLVGEARRLGSGSLALGDRADGVVAGPGRERKKEGMRPLGGERPTTQ